MDLHTVDDLTWAIKQPSGFLINKNSSEDGKKQVVHRLPLQNGCRGNLMQITRYNPKIYVASLQELLRLNLGIQGQDWDYCPHC